MTNKHVKIPIVCLLIVLGGWAFAKAIEQGANSKMSRSEAAQAIRNGNWNEAYESYRSLLKQPNSDGTVAAEDLKQALLCIQRLGKQKDQKGLVDLAIENQGRHWQVLHAASQGLNYSYFWNGSDWVYAGELNRTRSINLLLEAIDKSGALVSDGSETNKADLFLDLADAILNLRNGKAAWRLQTLTDLGQELDYTNLEQQQGVPQRNAPVDAEGNPVFYAEPENWESASSDGERYRWALQQARRCSDDGTADLEWAEFCQQQFSVQTLASYQWFRRADQSADDRRDAIAAVHTLRENETIARLANGLKRFELPKDYDYIAIYRKLIRDNKANRAPAYQKLVNIFLNRRQFSAAAEILIRQIETDGANPNLTRQLASIVEPRGIFDSLPTQLAGEQPKLGLVYRNASAVRFSARKVDVEALIADSKDFYRKWEQKGQRPNGQQLNNLVNPAQLFTTNRVATRLVGEPIEWNEKLEVREDHWDSRVETVAPLIESGLYLVDATLQHDGKEQKIRCLVWMQDTAIVRVPTENGVEYHVSDSSSGRPLDVEIELFGFRWERNKNRRGSSIQLAERRIETDRRGVAAVPKDLLDKEWRLLSVVRSKKGEGERLAFFNWDQLYNNQYRDESFVNLVAYGVSDRPMYRPGETVKVAVWLGQSAYGAELKNSRFVNENVILELYDPKGAKVATRKVVSDEYGRVSTEIELLKAASLGRYSLRVSMQRGKVISSNLSFRVEEYRKPEFEVTVDAPTEGVALGETFKAKISAQYYFGTPVTDAEVIVKVNRTEYSDSYYPFDPFDWCYGPGYWWWGYNYDWYPGYYRWCGSLRPTLIWWGGRASTPPELVLEDSLKLDANGEAFIEIDTALAKKIYGESDHQYQISVEVRDASRRTILGNGSVVVSREPFKIYSWSGRGFYRVGDTIEANIQARTLQGKLIQAQGKLELLRLSYDANRQPIERVIESWDVETGKDGRLEQKLEASSAGQYRVRLRLRAKNGAEVEGGFLFTIRGTDSDSNIEAQDFRFSNLELIPQKRNYAPGEKLKLQINSDRQDALVHLFVRPVDGVYKKQELVQLKKKTAFVEIDIRAEDQPNFFVEAYTVFDGKVHRETREIMVPPAKRVIDVQISSDKKEYQPGETAKVSLRFLDSAGEPVRGAFALAVYDRSLEQIASDVLPEDIRAYFWKWRRSHYPRLNDNLAFSTYPIGIQGVESWRALGLFGRGTADQARMLGRSGSLTRKSKQSDSFGMQPAPMAMAVDATAAQFAQAESMADGGGVTGGRGGAFGAVNAPDPAVRKDFADSAYWFVGVETDGDGMATVEFEMPENLGSWQMRAWVVTRDLQVGSSESQAVTRKNLMVRLQKPRFLVERDEVVVSAIVNNDLESAETVRVRLEIDGETSMQLLNDAEAEQTISVDSHGSMRVDWRCKATAEGDVILRTFAIGESESDAMQDEMPIVVNGILKTDSWAGTVREGDSESTIKIEIPSERRPEQSVLTVRVSPSLAGAMIDSLPYLVDFPYGCTEQTLNRFLPTVITQRTLQRMDVDLAELADSRVNLNAQDLPREGQVNRPDRWGRTENENPVYSESKVNEMVAVGIQRLTEMQTPDGGWGWFSGTRAKSYPHTTAVVVRGLILAQQNDCKIPDGVLERGVAWLERYQQQELEKLANAATDTKPFKGRAGATDALVLSVLAMAGKINSRMQDQLYKDRLELSVYGKVLLALVTNQAGNDEQTKMLRRNIEQFLEQDATNETAYLTAGKTWWYWYGDSIESNAMYLKLLAAVDPKGTTAPRIVKYLLNNRRHATYWKSTRDTALVVEAFADYLQATKELAGTSRVVVELDGKRLGQIDFTPQTLFRTNNTIEVRGRALTDGEHDLVIRREGSGNLYWNVYSTNFTREEEIAPAGLEVTVDRRYFLLTPTTRKLDLPGATANVVETKQAGFDRTQIQDLTAVPSGSLVEVELVIESKNDYEYLVIEDNKAACLEAVDTQSGYANVGKMWAYQELRDQKIAFFVQRLDRGTHSLRYRVRVETPGQFTALPAKIMAMYAPELVGNSADFDFVAEESSN